MFRTLIVAAVLIVDLFAQSAAPTSTGFTEARKLVINRAFTQKAAPDESTFDSAYKLSLPNPVQDKNFYLLSSFQRDREVRRLLSQDQALKQLARQKLLALRKAESCNDAGCFAELIQFDDPTINSIANALEILADESQFRQLVKKQLRPSGVFIKYKDLSNAQMLAAAWKDAANAMNRIIDVYGLGKDP